MALIRPAIATRLCGVDSLSQPVVHHKVVKSVSMESTPIRTLFDTFERYSAAGDAEGLAGLFAASFLSAGPNGAQTVKASDLLQVIPKRRQLFESIGWHSTKLVSLHETSLDERYRMVRTEWRWRLDRAGEAPVEITLPSTFIVHESRDGLRIVFYLTGDILTVLRERGLLPAAKD